MTVNPFYWLFYSLGVVVALLRRAAFFVGFALLDGADRIGQWGDWS